MTVAELEREVEQPQHMRALGRANEIRLARAEVKRQLKYGLISFEETLYMECTQSMLVKDLIMAMPRYGIVRVRKLLPDIPASEATTVQKLGDRRKAVLADIIRRKR